MLILDGAYGEGGGQILRTALLLSLLTDQPFRMENIRAGRSNPGVKAQHLEIMRALATMSDSTVAGAELGAEQITFRPGTLHPGSYTFDIGTAGAIPLFLQTLLPVLCFAGKPSEFTVTGGTDVRGAMTIVFWREVILPFLQPYTASITFDVLRHGYFPRNRSAKLRLKPTRIERGYRGLGGFPRIISRYTKTCSEISNFRLPNNSAPLVSIHLQSAAGYSTDIGGTERLPFPKVEVGCTLRSHHTSTRQIGPPNVQKCRR